MKSGQINCIGTDLQNRLCLGFYRFTVLETEICEFNFFQHISKTNKSLKVPIRQNVNTKQEAKKLLVTGRITTHGTDF